MGWLKRLGKPRATADGWTTGASIPTRASDIYHGALSADVALDWGGEIIPLLRPALLASGVVQAVVMAVGQMRRDDEGRAIFASSLRIVRRGGPAQLGPALQPVLAADWRGSAMVDTVFLAGDHAIFHDTGHALALIPEAFREPRQAISPVERDRFTPLAHSGIRNTADLLWYALNGHEALGRFALGVRSDGSTYELLAECSAVSPDMLMRAAAAVASDHRVHEFAIRPVEPGDPALADTDIVIPLRRDPEAPRSPAVIMGDALPLGPDLDLEPHEIEAIRVFATRSGAIRASLALVESRSLVEVTDRTIARDPVHVVIHSRRLFESRYPVLLFADGQAKDGHARLRLEGQLQDALDGRLADRAPRVRVTDAEDPLLGAASYAIRLV